MLERDHVEGQDAALRQRAASPPGHRSGRRHAWAPTCSTTTRGNRSRMVGGGELPGVRREHRRPREGDRVAEHLGPRGPSRMPRANAATAASPAPVGLPRSTSPIEPCQTSPATAQHHPVGAERDQRPRTPDSSREPAGRLERVGNLRHVGQLGEVRLDQGRRAGQCGRQRGATRVDDDRHPARGGGSRELTVGIDRRTTTGSDPAATTTDACAISCAARSRKAGQSSACSASLTIVASPVSSLTTVTVRRRSSRGLDGDQPHSAGRQVGREQLTGRSADRRHDADRPHPARAAPGPR